MSKRNFYIPIHTDVANVRLPLKIGAIVALVALLLSPTDFNTLAHAAVVSQTPAAIATTETKPVLNPAISPIDTEQEIRALMTSHLFNPALLQSPMARQHLLKQQQLAAESQDLGDFVGKFNQLWRDGPWSHMQLAPRRIPAAQMATFVNNMDAGPDAVQLRWIGTIPVLTVNTMMGKDTIQNIHQAFVQLQQTKAHQLIIDIRSNKGGAFAVKPLVEHLLTQPVEAGVFVSGQWYSQHQQAAPDFQEIANTPFWQQWDMQSFWQALLSQPLVRIRFSPAQPVFLGDVWLLTSHKTASAAEMAVAALQQANRVTVIGERTAGEMLSQTMFDLKGDLQLSLPIATYIAHQYGPIEGNGLEPDIHVPADQALQRALALAGQASAISTKATQLTYTDKD